jgi:hypothetical protein
MAPMAALLGALRNDAAEGGRVRLGCMRLRDAHPSRVRASDGWPPPLCSVPALALRRLLPQVRGECTR